MTLRHQSVTHLAITACLILARCSCSLSNLHVIPERPTASSVRSLEDIAVNSTYVSSYSIQFQGCHHIQQWNEYAEDDEDVRLLTKRLVRFRLLPYEQCTDYPAWSKYGDKVTQFVDDARKAFGSLKDYGEYIVDLGTFVYATLESSEQEEDDRCQEAQEYCDSECEFDDDYNNFVCLSNCYDAKNLPNCLKKYNNNDDANSLDAKDYAQCSALGDPNDDGTQYYFGPYCANQGGEIRFSVFTDDSCTNLSKCQDGKGSTCYEQETGVTLPYSQDTVVHESCLPCTENYLNIEQDMVQAADTEYTVDLSNYDYGYPRDVCSIIYTNSGKCETYMKNGGSDNTSCSYIRGIKIFTEEGTPNSRNVQRSFAADVSMGAMAIGISFMGMYVYYLRHVLRIPDISPKPYL